MTPLHADFAHALTRSIEASGKSYRALAADVTAAGGRLSAPTLRAWASGRSGPTRRASLDAVAVLEQVLGEPTGMLKRHLLERPTPKTARGAAHDLRELLSSVDELRKEWRIPSFLGTTRDALFSSLVLDGPLGGTVQHRSVMRAVHDGVSSVLLAVDPIGWSSTEEEDWSLSLRSGTLGRFAALREDVTIIEIVPPRPLRAGEVLVVELSHAVSEQEREAGCFRAISLIPTRYMAAKVTIPTGSGPWSFRRAATTLDGTVHAPLSGSALPGPASVENVTYGNGYDSVVSGAQAAIATVCWSTTGTRMPDACPARAGD